MKVKIPEKIIASVSPAKISYDEPMSAHTSIGTGGKAAALIAPGSVSELSFIIGELKAQRNYAVIGGGGSVLVSDGGYGGIIIKTLGIKGIERYGAYMTAAAGERLCDIAEAVSKCGFSGMEGARFQNGTLGAAVCANAPRLGFDIRTKVYVAEVLTKNGGAMVIKGEELSASGNRPLRIAQKGCVVLRAILRFESERAVQTERRAGKYAGSGKRLTGRKALCEVFYSDKKHDISRLIRECGFAGKAVGGASVCEDYPNCILNDGGASAGDVYSLLNEIMFAVLEKKGVQLKPNIKLLGNF